MLALQGHPITASNNQNDAIKGRKEVTLGGTKGSPNPVKSPSPKIARTVKKATRSNSHSSSKGNSKRVVDAISWDSLPSNLIKPGKVFDQHKPFAPMKFCNLCTEDIKFEALTLFYRNSIAREDFMTFSHVFSGLFSLKTY